MRTPKSIPKRDYRAPKPRRGLTALALLGLLPLLPLPFLAALRLTHPLHPLLFPPCLLLLSAATFILYWHDKRQAQTGGWRTPESTLHLAELLGGWPAAYLAQRTLRHKNAKPSYQVTFWAIVTLHQLAALDSLTSWHYTRAALAHLRS